MDHTNDDGNVHAHISSAKFYGGILAVLLFFTGLTYVLGGIHLGALNLAIAVVIATIKAALVVLFFMHMRWESKFNALVFVGALLFGGVFLAYTLNETEHRGLIDPERDTRVSPRTGVAPGTADGWERTYNAPTAEPAEKAPTNTSRPIEPLPLDGEIVRTALPAPEQVPLIELEGTEAGSLDRTSERPEAPAAPAEAPATPTPRRRAVPPAPAKAPARRRVAPAAPSDPPTGTTTP
jgi:cytochrome c oxidase subunit 4